MRLNVRGYIAKAAANCNRPCVLVPVGILALVIAFGKSVVAFVMRVF